MLETAVKARLPVIVSTTSDTVNLPYVLDVVTGEMPTDIAFSQMSKPKQGQFCYADAKGRRIDEPRKIYEAFAMAGATLLIVNPKETPHEFFQAGEVPVPKDLLKSILTKATGNEGLVQTVMPTLGGCTIKDAVEILKITMTRDHSLTPEGVMETRRTIFTPSRGIEQVDTTDLDYQAPTWLADFVQSERSFFLSSEDPRLVPRGILADGKPGTGKSMAAKYIAYKWGVPLYRLDMGSVQDKYVGMSQEHMRTALSKLDHEEPAVVLLDEVEKIFGGADSHDAKQDMLSQLLWWLAEHRSRVFTVMTTNDKDRLPQELYREGRIDRTFEFSGFMSLPEAEGFADWVLGTFEVDPVPIKPALCHSLSQALQEHEEVSHAHIAQAVYKAIKSSLIDK